MQVLVDGDVKELKIVDEKTSSEYTRDLLSNADALVYNDDTGLPELSPGDFEWWTDYIKTEGEISSRKEKIIDKVCSLPTSFEKYFLRDLALSYDSGDYGKIQKNTLAVLEEWEKKLSINNQ